MKMTAWHDHVGDASVLTAIAAIAAAILKAGHYLVQVALRATDTANDRLVDEINRSKERIVDLEIEVRELRAENVELRRQIALLNNDHE